MGTAHSHPGLAGEGAGCPVSKGSRDALTASAAAAAKGGGGAAPALSKERLSGPVYNVYNTVIDPTNMMPPPNQSLAPGQTMPLPVERVVSSIPKGGTSGTWLYPSPQMFYNSLVRKNKADGVDVPDVNIVVAIHNEMNERTWAQLKEWEALHAGEQTAGQPSLRRFMGNPYKLSPKARIKSWLGYGFPFDRHDWFVDRGAEQVHYIIDYYFNPNGPANAAAASEAGAPQLTTSIYVDVRPAVETLGGAVDRLRRFPERALAALRRPRFVAEGIDPSKGEPEEGPTHGQGAGVAAVTPAAAAAAASPAAQKWAAVDAKCKPLLAQLQVAGDEGSRRSAQVALNYCMGRELCPEEAGAFMRVLEANKAQGKEGEAGGREEEAFQAMTKCLMGEARKRKELS